MKRHAAFFKNIAALIMLLALTSLLLPFCTIKTIMNSTTVSGMEVIKTGVDVSYEYYSKGEIANDYIVRENLTWGDLKESVTYVANHDKANQIAVACIVILLPLLFCFLSMIFTWIASGKKTMILPTLLIALAFLENVVLIVFAFRLREFLTPYADITLLVGIYAFTLLCGIALAIFVMLWLTGGFLKPKDKDHDSDKKKVKRRKKDQSLDSNRRKKKRQRKQKRKKRDKKKSKKQKSYKEKWFSRNAESREDGSQNNDTIYEAREEAVKKSAAGHMTGLDGMYKGAKLEFSESENGIITIGTTQEAMNAILDGSMKNMDQIMQYNCVIKYSEEDRNYTISSHSITDILLKTDVEGAELIRLQEGDSTVVGANTVLYIGDNKNSIRLE